MSRSKETALLLAVGSTFLSLIPTAWVALRSNSIVLLTDFFRCAIEFGAIFISWLIVRRVARGDRRYYDYGFGKLEQVASLAVAGAMFASFVVITVLSVHRIYNPVEVENIGFGLILAGLSVFGNVWLWVYNQKLAAQEASPILESQWRLFRGKAAASAVVTLSLFIALIGSSSSIALYADPIGSLLLGGLLLHSAYRLTSTSMDDLLDRSVEEALRLVILRILVEHQARYHGLLGVRSRRVGAKIHIEISLDFSGKWNFSEVYAAMQAISAGLSTAIPGSEVLIVPHAV